MIPTKIFGQLNIESQGINGREFEFDEIMTFGKSKKSNSDIRYFRTYFIYVAFIIGLLVAFSFSAFSQPQIIMPKISTWEKIGDTIVHLDTFNMVKRGAVANDTIIHTTNEYPYFVTVSVKNQKWNELSKTNPYTINGNKYTPNKKPIYYLLRSGGLVIAQKWKIEKPILRDYSISQRIYRYMKLAFDGGYNVNQLNNYAPFDTLIHWDEYHYIPPIDTTIIN